MTSKKTMLRGQRNALNIVVLIPTLVSFFLEDQVFIGAALVAVPTIAYLNWVLYGRAWLDQRRAKASTNGSQSCPQTPDTPSQSKS